jgi:hypothetical protein
MGLFNGVFIGLRKGKAIQLIDRKSTQIETLFTDTKLIDGSQRKAAVYYNKYFNRIHHPDRQGF